MPSRHWLVGKRWRSGARALSFTACLSHGAWADDATRLAILDGLQAKFSACAAFYTVQGDCGRTRETARRLALVRKRADALAGSISMDPADAAMRLDLNLTAFRSLIGDSCAGLATLEARYAADCDPLSVDP